MGEQPIRDPAVILALAGPTASGKSEYAMRIAGELGAEIVACDALQVYRGMDIGTAKPTAEDCRAVRHHGLDVVPPSESFHAAAYRDVARAAIEEVRSRGRTPLFVGGAGLYLRAALDDIALGPPPDASLRASLERQPLHVLTEELVGRFPDRANVTDLANPRRVVRALELARSAAATDAAWAERRSRYAVRIAVVAPTVRSDLYAAIDRRVDAMIARGWLEEVRQLLAGPALSRTAGAAIGYHEVSEVLGRRLGLRDAVESTKRRTRAYARRQLTWFRKEPRARWFAAGDPATEGSLIDYFCGSSAT